MSPESPVIDVAPEIDLSPSIAPDPVIDTPAEGADLGMDDNESDNEPEPSDPVTPGVTDGPAIVNGKPSESMRAALAEVAKTNPQLAKDLKRSALELDAIRKIAPGGLKEVRELRQQMEALGDPDAITQTRDELEYFTDLDKQFTAGDPRFVQAMIDTDEGKSAFLKLAPSMWDQFKSLSPEAYDVQVSKATYDSMMENRIDLGLALMRNYLTEPVPVDADGFAQWRNKLIPEFNRMAEYYAKVDESRKKQVAPPATKAPVQDTSERDNFQKEKVQFEKSQYDAIGTGEASRIINAELDRLVAARKLTPTQRGAVLELGVSRLKAALLKVPKFNETALKHFQKRDKEGYLRHVQSAYRDTVPGVLKAAADSIAVSKGVRPAVAAVAQPGRTATPASAVNVIKSPDKGTIDFTRTTGDMIREGRAILLTGKEVRWKK